MKVFIKVKPGSRQNGLKIENNEVVVRIKAPAHEGKANDELVRFLSDVLNVPKSSISIVSGHATPFKRIEVPDSAAIRLRALASGGE